MIRKRELRRGESQRVVRNREGVGAKIFVCVCKTGDDCFLPFIRGPAFSMGHPKLTPQKHTNRLGKGRRVVEPKLDLDGVDGVSLCTLPLMEKGENAEKRFVIGVCVCDDEISTQNWVAAKP